jgi:hypothetical protein
MLNSWTSVRKNLLLVAVLTVIGAATGLAFTVVLSPQWEAIAVVAAGEVGAAKGQNLVTVTKTTWFENKVISRLKLPPESPEGRLFVNSFAARPILNSNSIELRARGFSRDAAEKTLEAVVAELQAWQTSLAKPRVDHLKRLAGHLEEQLRSQTEELTKARKPADGPSPPAQKLSASADLLSSAMTLQAIGQMSERRQKLAESITKIMQEIDETALVILSPSYSEERRAFPRRTVLAIVGSLSGLLIGFVIAVARSPQNRGMSQTGSSPAAAAD